MPMYTAAEMDVALVGEQLESTPTRTRSTVSYTRIIGSTAENRGH